MLFFYIKFIMKKKILTIFLAVVILTFIFISYLDQKVMPKVMAYALIRAEKIGTIIINEAISKQVLDSLNPDDLFIISKNNNGEIISIDFNTQIVNRILTTSTSHIEDSLNQIDNDIYYSIPVGVALNKSYLSSLGPKIPVKLELVGSVSNNIKTNITNYGINNALMEVNLDVLVTLKVILPFISKDIKIKTSIPLIIKMINGKVPEYYLNGYLNTPTM